MSLAENIYKFRTQQNMSQLDLADALEVSRQSVSKWETGTAVPELDKLIKMCDLFDVSLDVLVGRSVPNAAASAPSALRWISAFPTRKIVGSVLFACALLVFLVALVKNSILEGFLLVLPLVLCGIICFACSRHAGLWCAWVLGAPFLLIPLEQFMRADLATLIELFTRIPLLAFTVISFHKEKLELTKITKAFLGIGWIAWYISFSMWLGSLNAPPELYEGFNVALVLEALMFPLFAALLTTTMRIFKKK